MIVINGILMPSDRYGAIGVLIKHVDTFVLNNSIAEEFNSIFWEKKSSIEIEIEHAATKQCL